MRGIVAAGLVIAMTALAGCTDDPQPRFEEPTESPSASESTSSAAAEPEPWDERSEAGAEWFAKHWVATFNEAMATGDTQSLAALSGNGCRTCRGIAGQIDEVEARGGSFQGDGWRALDADANPLDGNRTSVAMNVLRSSQKVRESSDAPVKSFPATKGIYRADVTWVDGAWRMSELVNLS